MFQRGPGEGYGADAKADALALDTTLRCVRASHIVGRSYFVVLRGGGLGVGKRVGEGGNTAVEAWRSARAALSNVSRLEEQNT
jgi:hypothetical protein